MPKKQGPDTNCTCRDTAGAAAGEAAPHAARANSHLTPGRWPVQGGGLLEPHSGPCSGMQQEGTGVIPSGHMPFYVLGWLFLIKGPREGQSLPTRGQNSGALGFGLGQKGLFGSITWSPPRSPQVSPSENQAERPWASLSGRPGLHAGGLCWTGDLLCGAACQENSVHVSCVVSPSCEEARARPAEALRSRWSTHGPAPKPLRAGRFGLLFNKGRSMAVFDWLLLARCLGDPGTGWPLRPTPLRGSRPGAQPGRCCVRKYSFVADRRGARYENCFSVS